MPFFRISAILFICLMLQGCINTLFSGASLAYDHNSLEKTASDYSITMKINSALSNDLQLRHNSSNINASTFNRIVLLTGQVSSPYLQQRAAKIAQTVPGALKIYNGITVGKPESVATAIHDSWLTTKIKSKIIASKQNRPDSVKVVTENGVVYLMGIVTKQEADIAVNASEATDGVKKIVTIFFYMTMPKIG